MKNNVMSQKPCLISKVQHKTIDEDCKHEFWIKYIKEEHEKIQQNNTWGNLY